MEWKSKDYGPLDRVWSIFAVVNQIFFLVFSSFFLVDSHSRSRLPSFTEFFLGKRTRRWRRHPVLFF